MFTNLGWKSSWDEDDSSSSENCGLNFLYLGPCRFLLRGLNHVHVCKIDLNSHSFDVSSSCDEDFNLYDKFQIEASRGGVHNPRPNLGAAVPLSLWFPRPLLPVATVGKGEIMVHYQEEEVSVCDAHLDCRLGSSGLSSLWLR